RECGGGVGVELGEVGHQDAVAERVRGEHVDVDVQPARPAGQQRQLDAQDLAVGDVQTGVRGRVADPLQLVRGRLLVPGAQVVDRGGRTVQVRQDLLASVVGEPGPQHAVAAHQLPYGGVESAGVQAGAVELDVQVGGDGTEVGVLAAADPVRVLHHGERE